MANNVVRPQWRPKTFTSAEAMMDEVRNILDADKQTQRLIAARVGVSPSTIGNIASGKTRWPRATTLFPLLKAMGKRLAIEDDKR